jgi:hypothetical protein
MILNVFIFYCNNIVLCLDKDWRWIGNYENNIFYFSLTVLSIKVKYVIPKHSSLKKNNISKHLAHFWQLG